MRRALRHVLLGAALTVLAVTATLGPTLVVPAVIPGLGGGQTGTAVPRTVVGTLGTLAAVAASVGAGYYEQRRHGVGRDYRRFAGALLAGGVAVVLLAVLGLVVAGTATSLSPVLTVTSVLSALVAMPAVAVVAALAGVTVASLSTDWRRSDRPFGRPLVVPVGVALVAGGSVALDSVTRLLTTLSSGLGVPAWLPQFETIGVTVTVYTSLDSAVSGIVLILGAAALGAYAGRRHDFDESVRRFVVLVAVGATVGVAVFPLTVMAAVMGTSLAEFFGSNGRLALGLASLGSTFVDTAVVGTLAALAGLGAAAFEDEGDDESTVVDAGAETPADGPTGADRDESSEFAPVDGAPR